MASHTGKLIAVVSIIVAMALVGAAPAAPHYAITDLGTLGGSFSAAYGVNSSGHAAGESLVAGNLYHAFLYSGTMTDLGTLGGQQSGALAVNGSDQVVGWADIFSPFGETHHAFLWQNGSMQDLGTLGGNESVANGINATGTVAGMAETALSATHAVLWQNGAIKDVGTLPGDSSAGASAVNSSGQATGTSSNGIYAHAFFYDGTSLVAMGTLGGSSSQGNALNDVGQVVGSSTVASESWHAFVWQNGTMTDLGLLPNGVNSYGYGINRHGQIVGVGMIKLRNGQLVNHAILVSGGKMQDLNRLIAAGTGWVLNDALAISDTGIIAGFGTIHGQTHAYVLTPQ